MFDGKRSRVTVRKVVFRNNGPRTSLGKMCSLIKTKYKSFLSEGIPPIQAAETSPALLIRCFWSVHLPWPHAHLHSYRDQESRLRQTANVRFKLRISKNRK